MSRPDGSLLRSRPLGLAWLALAWVFAGGASAQETVRFSGREWTLRGDAEIVRQPDEGEVLRVRSGSVSLVGADFENGRIAFEVRTAGLRSFVGVGFRIDGPSREDFYLRPHNAGRFDAMQYTPVEQGVAAWQLYPEHNASYAVPVDRWLHIELVIAGPRLDVYLDHAEEPTLSVERLIRVPRAGGITLWASFPGRQPSDLYPTMFSNVVVTPDIASYAYPKAPAPDPASGLVAAWAVAGPFEPPEDEAVLESVPSDGQWTVAPADERGRVNLARWASETLGRGRDTMLAKVNLVADRTRVVRLGFGFSDRATVFLRGRPVFLGDNTYRSRSERYLGVMRVDNDVLFLALEKGDNEIVFAVAEAFGGWGVTARLLDREGVTVQTAMPVLTSRLSPATYHAPRPAKDAASLESDLTISPGPWSSIPMSPGRSPRAIDPRQRLR